MSITLFDVSYTIFKEAAALYTIYYIPTPSLDGYVLGCGSPEVVYHTRINGADKTDFINTLLPISILSEKEGDIYARPSISQNGNLQQQYEITDTVIYVGSAKQGVATSSIGWTIKRFLFVDGNPTEKGTTLADNAVWDDRASSSYI